jgi:hypothetical protein
MSRHSRNINLLDKINNIDEDCWEDEQEVSDFDNDRTENNCELFDSDTDEENILNTRRGQRRKRFIVSCESENEEGIETAEYQKERQLSEECSSKTIINTATDSPGRKSCQIRHCKVNKTKKICIKCKKCVCGKCAIQNAVICKKCAEDT